MRQSRRVGERKRLRTSHVASRSAAALMKRSTLRRPGSEKLVVSHEAPFLMARYRGHGRVWNSIMMMARDHRGVRPDGRF